MKPRPTAGGVLKEKARATSAIECQIRGHGCGVVVLKAIEEHITAEQDDCQQLGQADAIVAPCSSVPVRCGIRALFSLRAVLSVFRALCLGLW